MKNSTSFFIILGAFAQPVLHNKAFANSLNEKKNAYTLGAGQGGDMGVQQDRGG